MSELAVLQRDFPWIPWMEPIRVSLTDGSASGYACRICIARGGLYAGEVPLLTQVPDIVRDHIRERHE